MKYKARIWIYFKNLAKHKVANRGNWWMTVFLTKKKKVIKIRGKTLYLSGLEIIVLWTSDFNRRIKRISWQDSTLIWMETEGNIYPKVVFWSDEKKDV